MYNCRNDSLVYTRKATISHIRHIQAQPYVYNEICVNWKETTYWMTKLHEWYLTINRLATAGLQYLFSSGEASLSFVCHRAVLAPSLDRSRKPLSSIMQYYSDLIICYQTHAPYMSRYEASMTNMHCIVYVMNRQCDNRPERALLLRKQRK